MNSTPDRGDELTLLTRREAIQRTAVMLGIALSPSMLAAVLRAQSAPSGGKPMHLTAQQFETASALAERIIPRTDTPGALDVAVPAFIDLMVGGYMTDEEKNIFTAGLADAETRSTAAHRRKFAQLSPAQQDALLKTIADESQNKEKTFFFQIKELTLLGYFTSERVGKTVLHYDPIPGRFDACVPISDVGNRAWTR